jgi:hypothetical protein
MSGEGVVFFLFFFFFFFPHRIFDFVILFSCLYFICVYRSNLGKHSFMLYLN